MLISLETKHRDLNFKLVPMNQFCVLMLLSLYLSSLIQQQVQLDTLNIYIFFPLNYIFRVWSQRQTKTVYWG